MEITRIRVTPVKSPAAEPRPYVIHSINPVYYYRDLKYDAPPDTRPKQPDGPDSLIIEIETDEGVTGVSQKGYGLPGAYTARHRRPSTDARSRRKAMACPARIPSL